MYMHMFSLCVADSPSATMEAALGHLHKGGDAAFGGPPTFVESIVGDGEAANIAKTYAYTYQMCPYLHICHDSYYLPYVGTAAISLNMPLAYRVLTHICKSIRSKRLPLSPKPRRPPAEKNPSVLKSDLQQPK